ncbi:MAG: glutamate--tRNA ligase [Gammaproteobacteria bacterium]
MSVVTRFAPSPTGFLHIGGARTALFSYLFAKKHGGKFLLRVEDTDRERSTDAAVRAIFDGMEWLNLAADERPVFQTQRYDRYREVADQLLAKGDAYRCYCTKPELDEMRAGQMARKEKPRYDGRCRNRKGVPMGAPQLPSVIRFRNPEVGSTVVNDLIKGDITFRNDELDDLIVVRSDGNPTYNFCVVVDDWDMKVTHVIRGDDHVNNTPRQINILKALGATPPAYAHVPMILGSDGVKLSKRHGAVSVVEYRALGFHPDAVLNYLVRLGWSHGDQELFTRAEMVKLFDIGKVQKAPARFDLEKLVWVNHELLKRMEPAAAIGEFYWHMERIGASCKDGPRLEDVFLAQRERCKTFVEMAEKSRFFYEAPKEYNEKDAARHFNAAAVDILEALASQLATLNPWMPDGIHGAVNGLAQQRGVALGQVAQPIRVAVAGMAISPPIDQTLHLLGREQTLARLAAAVAHIAARP